MMRQDKVTVVGVSTKNLRTNQKYDFATQAKYLMADIEDVVKKIQHRDMIIVVLHEYALHDKGKKIVPHRHKAYFEDLINQTVKKFDNLIIIAGTILYSKPVNNKQHNILARFQETMPYGSPIQTYMSEFQKFTKFGGKANNYTRNICYSAWSSRLDNMDNSKEPVDANSADPKIEKPANSGDDSHASQSEFNFWSRNKIIPYYDSTNAAIEPCNDIVFKPGHLPNTFFIQNIPCIVEICMEHNVHFIKDLVETNKISKPIFHFVVSSPTASIEENFIGKYNIHVDSASGISVFINESIDGPQMDLEVFAYDACVPIPRLRAVRLSTINAASAGLQALSVVKL